MRLDVLFQHNTVEGFIGAKLHGAQVKRLLATLIAQMTGQALLAQILAVTRQTMVLFIVRYVARFRATFEVRHSHLVKQIAGGGADKPARRRLLVHQQRVGPL